MKTLVLAFTLALLSYAQEHGAAPLARPAQHGTPPAAVQHGSEHAQAAVQHGEGHEEQPMANEIWWKWANFAILAAGLGFLIGRTAAGPFFRSRTEQIQKGIAEASAMRSQAEARAQAIEQRIGNLNAEVAALREKSKEEVSREGERIRQETAQYIEKIQRQAEVEIASAAKNASQELKAFAAQLAVDLAAQQIGERITPENQEQIADSFIGDVRRKAALN